LTLSILRNRAAEIVVRRDGIDVDAGVTRFQLQVLAAPPRPVEWTAMRPLAVDLYPVVAIRLRALDQFLECQRAPAIPHTEIRDAVEAEFHGWVLRSGNTTPRGAGGEYRVPVEARITRTQPVPGTRHPDNLF
jgi:hypothetical protein